jgi:hypothetical protein
VPEDEAAEELAPITSQLAYVRSELGRRDEALAAYQVCLLTRPTCRPPSLPSKCGCIDVHGASHPAASQNAADFTERR